MKHHDPVPLSELSYAPEHLRKALGAARADVPSDAQLARLAARMPVGAPPAAPGAGAPAVGSAAVPSTLSGALIGAALGVVVSGVGFFWPASSHAPAARPPALESAGVPTATTASPPAAVVTIARRETPSVAPVATAQASGSQAAAPAAPSGAPPPLAASSAPENVEPAGPPSGGAFATSLETEAHLLERAQDALASNAAQALALTQEHAARFPSGVLGQEREVVAIQALLKLGRVDEAKARGAAFVEAHPRSAHRRRVEALLGL
jgi:hypothetical protein